MNQDPNFNRVIVTKDKRAIQRPPYKRIIFVCCNTREQGVCCSPPGTLEGQEIREWLKEYVKTKGLKGKVRVSRSGCMDLCSQGPNVMIFPDNVWLKGVRKEDLEEIAAHYIDAAAEAEND